MTTQHISYWDFVDESLEIAYRGIKDGIVSCTIDDIFEETGPDIIPPGFVPEVIGQVTEINEYHDYLVFDNEGRIRRNSTVDPRERL